MRLTFSHGGVPIFDLILFETVDDGPEPITAGIFSDTTLPAPVAPDLYYEDRFGFLR
jgi:hypothetical protein